MQHSDPTSAQPTSEARIREFHELYRGEFPFVWAAARRLGVPPAAIEDAVQDVFVTAYRRLEHLRFEVSARAWLYGVTRRVASRYHRGVFRMARRVAALGASTEPPREAPQERLAQTQRIDRLLDRLGPRTRAAWEMAELLGMSGPEIAAELGLPLNTVYSRVRLARQQLQTVLRDPQQLDRWLDDARRDDAPPERAQQRAWALLLPALAKSGPAAAGLGALATTRAAVVATLTLVGVVVIARPGPPAPDDGDAARSPAPVDAVRPRAAAVDGDAARPPAAPADLAATSPSAAPPDIDAANPSAAPIASPPGPAAPPLTAPTDDGAAGADEDAARLARARAQPGDRLAEEVALLDRAQDALNAGDAATALDRVAEHARRFPDGALVDLREAARVQALCLAGDTAAALAAAAQLVEAHPRSSVAQRHRDKFKICPH